MRNVMGEIQHEVFAIAGVTKANLLQNVQDKIMKSMEKDLTFDEAKEQLLKDAKDGEILSDSKLRFVFSQNMYGMNGKVKCEKQMKSSLPYIQYVHSRSMGRAYKPNYRERHWKAHGKVFRKNDPWLKTNMPPNGFRCKCTTRAISEHRLKQMGIVPEKRGAVPQMAEEGFDYHMCGSAVEQLKKIKSAQRKKAKEGDKVAQLSLFEIQYKEVKHFENLCSRENAEQNATQKQKDHFKSLCENAKVSTESLKKIINLYAKDKKFSFDEIFNIFNFKSERDLELEIHTILAYNPKLSGGKIFDSLEIYKNTGKNARAGVSASKDILHIREDLKDDYLKLFQKLKSNRKELKLDDIEEERLLQTLHHEILHLRSDRKNAGKSTGNKISLSEMINEYFSLQKYEELTKVFNVVPNHKQAISKLQGANFQNVQRFERLLKVLNPKNKFTDIKLNDKIDWFDPQKDIVDYLHKWSGVKEDKIEEVLNVIIDDVKFDTKLRDLRKNIKLL
jgi:SPP1 gp7 family putative phage head morphogenesis protein